MSADICSRQINRAAVSVQDTPPCFIFGEDLKFCDFSVNMLQALERT